MKVVTAASNFAQGQIDHDMMGRFDLPIYSSGMDVFKNFTGNYKGNAIFSAGFLSRIAFQDCAFVEFKFGITQNYLCTFYESEVQFLAFDTDGNFGWVLDGSSDTLIVDSPYTLVDAKTISQKGGYTQNSDVMYITHRAYEPYKLTRTSATAFTLATYSRTSDPFTGAGDWPGVCSFYKGKLYMGSTNNKLTTLWNSNAGLYDDFTIQDPITDASGFSFTLTDITQQIEWLFPGDNSLIAGATDGIIAINGGAVNTAITPSTVQATITSAEPTNGFYPFKRDGLMFYGGRASRNMYYFRYDILTEQFLSKDANLAAYDITRGGLQKMRYKKDRNSLIFMLRGDNVLLSNVFQEAEKINGWHFRTTNGSFSDVGVIGDNNGDPQLFVLVERNGTFYIEQQASYIEFKKRADFWTPSDDSSNQQKYQDMDNEAYLRYVSEQLRGCTYLDNAMSFSDLRTSTITFTPTGTDPSTGTPLGVVVSTAPDFLPGDVGKHIVYQTATGYESGRFEITSYSISGSGTTVGVTVLQDPMQKFEQTLYTWSSWYKSFTTVSGLDQYDGQTIGLVTDGGFLDTATVSGGTIELPNETTSIVVGYQYTGFIKSMSLGFVFQSMNTQVTLKEIASFDLRCVNTLGLQVGSSPYWLEDVQLRTPSDINYLPPVPIDGTINVDYTDDSEEDKFFYAIQSLPLPACIAAYVVTANYARTT